MEGQIQPVEPIGLRYRIDDDGAPTTENFVPPLPTRGDDSKPVAVVTKYGKNFGIKLVRRDHDAWHLRPIGCTRLERYLGQRLQPDTPVQLAWLREIVQAGYLISARNQQPIHERELERRLLSPSKRSPAKVVLSSKPLGTTPKQQPAPVAEEPKREIRLRWRTVNGQRLQITSAGHADALGWRLNPQGQRPSGPASTLVLAFAKSRQELYVRIPLANVGVATFHFLDTAFPILKKAGIRVGDSIGPKTWRTLWSGGHVYSDGQGIVDSGQPAVSPQAVVLPKSTTIRASKTKAANPASAPAAPIASSPVSVKGKSSKQVNTRSALPNAVPMPPGPQHLEPAAIYSVPMLAAAPDALPLPEAAFSDHISQTLASQQVEASPYQVRSMTEHSPHVRHPLVNATSVPSGRARRAQWAKMLLLSVAIVVLLLAVF